MSHAEELTNWMWRRPGPLAPLLPMVRARAKRVIFLFLHGGPS
jgi:hypothetical protein